ncbi:hypothetical protein K450DRAFT_250340 [Umbelopsis ramanniana AG]|uniref:CUE domain-containing protein n=1 Tax=Umbelopsis ramanniana AG TaxID=1314678 RepID=A0AAD5HCF8_UMBRA|nr:uncharacterized protein K450DRAFT_250340 [Umbelopsis ramanniana AG]KAI8577844.1 hypothetical protein K450DRAFT_250340 [Umbelopsis ramanniana AG]
MIAIPPYVPRSVAGISHDEWDIAHRLWAGSIQDLLLAESIGAAISDFPDLPQFLDTFFTAQLSEPEYADIELLRLVFLLYVRATASLAADSALASADMFTPDRLLNFATLYTKANIKVVRNCFQQITDNITDVLEQYTQSIGTITEFYASFNRQVLTDAELHQILALSTGLDALFSASTSIAQAFESSQDFITSLVTLYDGPLKQTAIDLRNKNEKDKVRLVRSTKLTLLSIFNNLIDASFFSQFGYATNLHDWEVLEKREDSADGNLETIHHLNNMLLDLIERSGIDTSVTSLIDAPLIIDVEIEAMLGNKISKVNREKFHGEDEQLEFLVLSMEHLRAMCTTTESHQRRKQQMKSLKSTLQAPRPTPAVTTPQPDESYIKMTILISQITDLFPDLGAGFVEACLMHYGGNVEQVTNQLLEDSLPPNLATMDRTLARKPMTAEQPADEQVSTVMSNLSLSDDSQLRTRRNIFDNDEFDVFAGKKVQTQQIHRGKQNRGTADKLLDDKSFIQSEKANLLERIANIYEDEIDDTYDDVGMPTGKVDLGAVEDGSEDVVRERKTEIDPGIIHESDLVHAFVNNITIFDRSAASRRSPQRAQLRKATNMTDEQLEGWSIMFSRNPRKQRILDKYALWDGQQSELQDAPSAPKQNERNPRPPKTPTQERNYKDKNKAKMANHSRKKMHDKKIGRSMPPPS